MSFSYAEIWQHMGVPAMVIAGILLVMGLASLTVLPRADLHPAALARRVACLRHEHGGQDPRG